MLNKNGLFGGGGYALVNAAVIAISTSSVVVAEEECSVRNKQNQIYWRLYANNERLKAEGEYAWIKDEEYRDSIINVIGKAIGDCMALENEFKCNDREELGGRIILFEDEDKYKDPYDYTIKNWNAVYLYNAVNLAINNKKCWDRYHYYDSKELNSENLLSECHERIKEHFYKEFNIPKKDDEELKQKLKKINEETDKEERQIMDILEWEHTRKANWLKSLEKKAQDDLKAHIDLCTKQLKDIEGLQKALTNFNENKGDIKTLYQEARNKADQAKKPRKLRDGNLWSDECTLHENQVAFIRAYLERRRDLIVQKELPQKLEQAKSNILEYFQALRLDEILRDVYRYYSQNRPFSPAEKTKETVRIVTGGPEYERFQYDILMDLEVTPTSYDQGNKRLFDEIGYEPDFFVREDDIWSKNKNGEICIVGVRKMKWTDRGLSAGFEKTELAPYGWAYEDTKYADLLKLLEGLVVPMKKYYDPMYL